MGFEVLVVALIFVGVALTAYVVALQAMDLIE